MKKILVWLSGGVDSAVAAYLLKEQWYQVVAGFMKNYVDEENPNCSTYKDASEAIKVARFLWIDILSFDLRQEYEDKIIKYIYDGYQKWITPNPDILCNTLIKFDVFLDKAINAWFDWIATGHYARIEKASLNKGGAEQSEAEGLNYQYCIPYNPSLIPKAKELRKNMTKAEKKLWYDFLRNLDIKVLRQQPIDQFIVDFYIASKKLVIEIDWETHRTDDEIQYDNKRTEILESHWLHIIRFTNDEVYKNFEGVCNKIIEIIDKIPPTPLNKGDYSYKLLRWVDYNKDQTYFLSWLNQYQLSKALFPIGWMTKPEVRELAKKVWLPNAERPDSQWLCFVWKVPMRTFLKKRLPIKKGDIVLMDWTKVWEHDWAYFFTIWQSRGLDINKKAFVVKIDVEKNLVYVSYDKYEPELITKHIDVKDWHWIGQEYELPLECSTKIRYRQEPNPSTMENKDWKIFFSYNQDQRWVAKWQSVVAYLWDECLWWGVIE